MSNEHIPQEELPDTMVNTVVAITEYLDLKLAQLDGKTDVVEAADKESAQRAANVARTDITHEVGAMEAEATELLDDYARSKDPSTGRAIEELRDNHLQALVEKGNLPPQ